MEVSISVSLSNSRFFDIKIGDSVIGSVSYVPGASELYYEWKNPQSGKSYEIKVRERRIRSLDNSSEATSPWNIVLPPTDCSSFAPRNATIVSPRGYSCENAVWVFGTSNWAGTQTCTAATYGQRIGNPAKGDEWYTDLLFEKSDLFEQLIDRPNLLKFLGVEIPKAMLATAKIGKAAGIAARAIIRSRISKGLIALFSGNSGRIIAGVVDFFDEGEPKAYYTARPSSNCEEERHNLPPFNESRMDTGVYWKRVQYSATDEKDVTVKYGGILHPLKRQLVQPGWTCVPYIAQIERIVSSIAWSDAENYCESTTQKQCDLHNTWKRAKSKKNTSANSKNSGDDSDATPTLTATPACWYGIKYWPGTTEINRATGCLTAAQKTSQEGDYDAWTTEQPW
ncbi:MAG: hypothetical protein OXF99_07290 [bacterium]|nr:hypothetical protein [bacterium]